MNFHQNIFGVWIFTHIYKPYQTSVNLKKFNSLQFFFVKTRSIWSSRTIIHGNYMGITTYGSPYEHTHNLFLKILSLVFIVEEIQPNSRGIGIPHWVQIFYLLSIYDHHGIPPQHDHVEKKSFWPRMNTMKTIEMNSLFFCSYILSQIVLGPRFSTKNIENPDWNLRVSRLSFP